MPGFGCRPPWRSTSRPSSWRSASSISPCTIGDRASSTACWADSAEAGRVLGSRSLAREGEFCMTTRRVPSEGTAPPRRLKDLRNVGKAALADFAVLQIETVEDLATRDPADLYRTLQERTSRRHDPCVQDVFAA